MSSPHSPGTHATPSAPRPHRPALWSVDPALGSAYSPTPPGATAQLPSSSRGVWVSLARCHHRPSGDWPQPVPGFSFEAIVGRSHDFELVARRMAWASRPALRKLVGARSGRDLSASQNSRFSSLSPQVSHVQS